MVDVVYVNIWGNRIGAITWDSTKAYGSFEYEPDFIDKGLDLSPILLPINNAKGRIFSFPELRNSNTFKGLPGLISDILPDKYGKAIINSWLAQQGRPTDSLNPIETLSFIGKRGMGAIEIEPISFEPANKSKKLEISSMIGIADDIMSGKKDFRSKLSKNDEQALLDILKIGTSAGGARAKAIITYNKKTKEVRSGQVNAPEGFEHWLIKFDGVTDNQFGSSQGYGRVEMAYYYMAQMAKIEMEECQLFEENGRAHFMTKRFDRIGRKQKLHVQSLCAMRHYDFNDVNAYSYEQLFETMRLLNLPYPQADQLYRRMVFNVLSRNCDDHTKNFAFMMNDSGQWKLSPAFDICHAYRPGSTWVSQHALSINGKRRDFIYEDFIQVADNMNIKSPNIIIMEVQESINSWDYFSKELEVDEKLSEAIKKTFVRI